MEDINKDIKELEESIKEAYRCYDYDLDYNPLSKGIAEIIEHLIKAYKELEEENEKLKSDNLEYQRTQDIFDERTYRKKYLEERRKEEPNLLYPDSDEIYKRYYKLKEENKRLKASHIITHNKVSDEEKAKIFDVIDNSIDTYFEKSKPYWEQIMTKDKMSIEEAETIINDMYQDRNKILENNNVIDVSRLDDVKFTNLEFASVRAIREIQSLERKLDNSIPVSLIKETIEEYKKIIDKYDKQMENDEDTDLSYEEARNYMCKIESYKELLEKRK